MLSLRIQDYSEARIIYLVGELNALACTNLSRILEERFQLNIPFIVLDLSGVNELTSAAQCVIFEAYMKLHKKHVNDGVVLCGLNKDVGKLINMTGLSKLVSVYPTLDIALRAIESD